MLGEFAVWNRSPSQARRVSVKWQLKMPNFCGEFLFGGFLPKLHLQETEGKKAIHSFSYMAYCERAVCDLYCLNSVWKHLLPFQSQGRLFGTIRTPLF